MTHESNRMVRGKQFLLADASASLPAVCPHESARLVIGRAHPTSSPRHSPIAPSDVAAMRHFGMALRITC